MAKSEFGKNLEELGRQYQNLKSQLVENKAYQDFYEIVKKLNDLGINPNIPSGLEKIEDSGFVNPVKRIEKIEEQKAITPNLENIVNFNEIPLIKQDYEVLVEMLQDTVYNPEDAAVIKIKNKRIVSLGFNHNPLTFLPESIGNLTSLKKLNVKYNKLTSLPESIGNLTSLQQLYLYENPLTFLPESIGNLTSLKELDVGYNKLTSLPESIGNLTSLGELNVVYNKLTSLPESIGNLTSLRELNVGHNKLTSLPESIGNLTSLQQLYLYENPIKRKDKKLFIKHLREKGASVYS